MDKIDFVNAQQPAINDVNLNLLQDNIEREINAQVSGDTLPIGALLPFSGNSIPTNWLVCDGREISRTDYSQLFNVIGTRYGIGDGSTTFNLPNTKAKTVVGQDTSNTKFDTIGETGTITDGTGDVQFLVQRYIIKAFQSAGTVANILNAYQSSSTDAYSAYYINNLTTYSRYEKRIGTWIDGNPIYRKVVNTGTLPNTQSKTVAHNIENFKRIIRIYGNAYDPIAGAIYSLPITNSEGVQYQVALRVNTTNITIATGIDRSNFTESYVVLEYTKTTN